MKQLSMKFKVQGNVRALIRRIKKNYDQCTLLLQKNVELETAAHPRARTILAPPFYSIMLDIAYRFSGQTFKNFRKTIKMYTFVMVWLISRATNIMALEGIETQYVSQAIEHHSCRYGVEADIFIYQGT